jgi:hypothetical protein
MITAIRLKERDKRANFLCRSYTTGAGTIFHAGQHGLPSPVRIITDPQDIAECRTVPQFEVLELPDEQALARLLNREMEGRARRGQPPVRAEVSTVKPAAVAAAVLAPTPIGPPEPPEPVVTNLDPDGPDPDLDVILAPTPAPVADEPAPPPRSPEQCKGGRKPRR